MKRTFDKFLAKFLPLLAAGVTLALTATVHACPSCKESIPNSDAADPQNVAAGINNSVYFMLGAFLAVLGFVGHISLKAIRSTDTAQRGFPVAPPRQ